MSGQSTEIDHFSIDPYYAFGTEPRIIKKRKKIQSYVAGQWSREGGGIESKTR